MVAVGCKKGFAWVKIPIFELIDLAHNGHVGCVVSPDDGAIAEIFFRQLEVAVILIDGHWRVDGCFRGSD